jgi:hypothetical protein
LKVESQQLKVKGLKVGEAQHRVHSALSRRKAGGAGERWVVGQT